MWLNVVDLEATCWEGTPPAGETREIIEVGLTALNLTTGERRRAPRMLVRPTRSQVSPFCTQLTGITAGQLRSAPTFEELAPELRRLDALSGTWGSWGNFDRRLLSEQAEQLGLLPVMNRQHINLKTTYAGRLHLRRAPGMMAALEREGIRHEGTHHRGDDDSWNISALAWLMQRRGWLEIGPLPFDQSAAT